MKYRVIIYYNGQIYTDTFKTIKQAENKYIETLKFLRDCDSKMLIEGWTLYLTDITMYVVYQLDRSVGTTPTKYNK